MWKNSSDFPSRPLGRRQQLRGSFRAVRHEARRIAGLRIDRPRTPRRLAVDGRLPLQALRQASGRIGPSPPPAERSNASNDDDNDDDHYPANNDLTDFHGFLLERREMLQVE